MKLMRIRVLEEKHKQRPGRRVFLALYPDATVTRRGELVPVAELKPGDIIRYKGEPLRVVSAEEWR